MVLPTPLPYGIRDIKITAYTDAGATTLAGTSIDLPNSRTLSFAEAEDFVELRGDDQTATIRGKGPGVDWDMEGGGVSFEVVQAMYGGTITVSGTTPNQKKTFSKKTTDVRPWFKAEGQSISDSGGDFHNVLWKCRCTKDLKGEQADGAFLLYGTGGQALPCSMPANLNALYDWIQNETAVAIP